MVGKGGGGVNRGAVWGGGVNRGAVSGGGGLTEGRYIGGGGG